MLVKERAALWIKQEIKYSVKQVPYYLLEAAKRITAQDSLKGPGGVLLGFGKDLGIEIYNKRRNKQKEV